MPNPTQNPSPNKRSGLTVHSSLGRGNIVGNDRFPSSGKEVEEEEGEEELSTPVVVLTSEEIRNFKLTSRSGELINDLSYLGSDIAYLKKGDIPKQASHIYEITSTLEEVGIPNCVIGVQALNFYGAKRVGDVSLSLHIRCYYQWVKKGGVYLGVPTVLHVPC
jgi:hypothetical protein